MTCSTATWIKDGWNLMELGKKHHGNSSEMLSCTFMEPMLLDSCSYPYIQYKKVNIYLITLLYYIAVLEVLLPYMTVLTPMLK